MKNTLLWYRLVGVFVGQMLGNTWYVGDSPHLGQAVFHGVVELAQGRCRVCTGVQFSTGAWNRWTEQARLVKTVKVCIRLAKACADQTVGGPLR